MIHQSKLQARERGVHSQTLATINYCLFFFLFLSQFKRLTKLRTEVVYLLLLKGLHLVSTSKHVVEVFLSPKY